MTMKNGHQVPVVRLNADLHKFLKIRSIIEDTTMQVILERLVTQYRQSLESEAK